MKFCAIENSYLLNYFGAHIVTLLSITFGMVVGWTSPYLAQLTSDEGLFYVTEREASWVASLMPFGRMFGSIVGAVIMEYHGSKIALFSAGLPNIVGWICIIFANSAKWLYVSRMFAGERLLSFNSNGVFACCACDVKRQCRRSHLSQVFPSGSSSAVFPCTSGK